jgi:hypothetical protein
MLQINDLRLVEAVTNADTTRHGAVTEQRLICRRSEAVARQEADPPSLRYGATRVETGGQKARSIVVEAWPDMDDRSEKPVTSVTSLIVNDLARNNCRYKPVTSPLH